MSEQEQPAAGTHDRLPDSRYEGQDRQNQRRGHNQRRALTQDSEGQMSRDYRRYGTQDNPEQLTFEEVVRVGKQPLRVVGGGGKENGQTDPDHRD